MAQSAALSLFVTALAIASSVACGSSRNRNNYEGAAVALGFGVAAAGVHRAATGGCFAQCTHGLMCDRESGQCVPYESLAGRRSLRPHGVDAGVATADAEADAGVSDAEDAGASE